MRVLLLALALHAGSAHAFTLRDFLHGGNPNADIDPLARVHLCENDLEKSWPTPVELGRFEDVIGATEAYVEGWRMADDPHAFVREHEDEAVSLLSQGYGMRAKLDFARWNNEQSLANVLETRMLQLETINFFLGYVATEAELDELQTKIQSDLVQPNHSRTDIEALRVNMEVLTQQAVLIDLRTQGGYEVPLEIYELWQAVFRAYLKKKTV